MSQLSFSSHNREIKDLLPYPKNQWNLAHSQLFYHLMAAYDHTVVAHQVTESSTEKENTQIV